MVFNKRVLFVLLLVFSISLVNYAQSDVSQFGKMWSFDNIPIEKINNNYNVKLNENWYNDVMQSALQLGNGCSASFVSETGLIMTNHHCVRDAILPIQQKDEDFLANGFYAEQRFNERKIPNMFADQLLKVENVTRLILINEDENISDKEKEDNINKRITLLEKEYNTKYNLVCKVIPLYSGAKYVMHCYKRYNDIRLVMVPEFQIASTGWDWDNFTYPRYELDFAFLRAYDSLGNPVQTKSYFKWSENGAKEDELTFVIGRPGNTDRLLSSYQYKYMKKYLYPKRVMLMSKFYDVYEYFYNNNAESNNKYLHNIMSVGNSKKSFNGSLDALSIENLKDKVKSEKYLLDQVKGNSELSTKYGKVFDDLKSVFEKLSQIGNEYETLINLRRANSVIYVDLANKINRMAEQLLLPDSLRGKDYKNENIEKYKEKLILDKLNDEVQIKLFSALIDYLKTNLGRDEILDNAGGKNCEEIAINLVNSSIFSSKEKLEEFLSKPAEKLKENNDPILNLINGYRNRLSDIQPKANKLFATIDNLNRLLGDMHFAVYGESFSPDATSTLRISDGVIKGYEYNGTISPGKTTYFGLFDRYFSFGEKTYPWGLPNKWVENISGIQLSTPINFCSTHDIVGGNSGSAAINMNKEIIGLIFDGNYESLAGNFFYKPESNRAVGVDSKGLLYSLKYIYKTEKLLEELSGNK